jgi:hypothetical protein
MTLIDAYKEKNKLVSLNTFELEALSFALDYMHKREMALIDEIHKANMKNITESFKQELTKVE